MIFSLISDIISVCKFLLNKIIFKRLGIGGNLNAPGLSVNLMKDGEMVRSSFLGRLEEIRKKKPRYFNVKEDDSYIIMENNGNYVIIEDQRIDIYSKTYHVGEENDIEVKMYIENILKNSIKTLDKE